MNGKHNISNLGKKRKVSYSIDDIEDTDCSTDAFFKQSVRMFRERNPNK